MASQRIFTRANPDLNPTEVVFDPENILQNYRKKSEPSTPYFQRFGSYSDKEIIDIHNLGFDLKFEQSLFQCKSESELKEVVPNSVNFQSPTHRDFLKKGKAPENAVKLSVGQH